MIDEGHTVGNHTVNHPTLVDISNEKIKKEVMDLHTAIYNEFGYEMKYVRAPKGEISERALAVTQSLGYTNVMWSNAYDDWLNNKQGREDYGKKMVMNNMHNGCILLLHSTSKDNSNILDYLIKEIQKEGYTFKSLDEFE
jgi:peptidoglycan-N-acetylmuramic acid deacetylase